jgi:hypothetical protein
VKIHQKLFGDGIKFLCNLNLYNRQTQKKYLEIGFCRKESYRQKKA